MHFGKIKKEIGLALPILLMIFLPAIVFGYSKGRHALVIGNGDYDCGPLKNAVSDARNMANALKRLGFDTVLVEDADLVAMEKAVRRFGEQLSSGGDGVLFYAGHAVQIGNINYLIPVRENIRGEADLKYRSLNMGYVLEVIQEAGNRSNIIILDACRNNPFPSRVRSASRGLAPMSSPGGSYIVYSTDPGNVAVDGVFTKYLLKHMFTPGMMIEKVIKNVRVDVARETENQQIPWEHSSLFTDFYFMEKSAPAPGREERFIDSGFGTVTDQKTGLMWAIRDNGSDILWDAGRAYCKTYNAGGHNDWRMPTAAELQSIYDPDAVNLHEKTGGCSGIVHLAAPFRASCYAFWSSETRGADAGAFYFDTGESRWDPQNIGQDIRVLPVRNPH